MKRFLPIYVPVQKCDLVIKQVEVKLKINNARNIKLNLSPSLLRIVWIDKHKNAERI